MRRGAMFVVGGVVAFALAMVGASVYLARPAAEVDPQQQLALGQKVYATHCAACHGANLEGQPNWRERRADGRLPAPPHDASGHTWHHSDRVLFELTKRGTAAVIGGGYQSDMPAYESILSDDEIRAVLAWIRSQWPPDIQRKQREIDARG